MTLIVSPVVMTQLIFWLEVFNVLPAMKDILFILLLSHAWSVEMEKFKEMKLAMMEVLEDVLKLAKVLH